MTWLTASSSDRTTPRPTSSRRSPGKAKYAEDFRAEGMLFAKLLLSPMPHARVTRIDTSAALAMPGVKAILTADDLPAPADAVTDIGQTIRANIDGERALTNEPVYQGEPILAVAAVDETAAEAIERIEIDYEPLPLRVDPLVSLRPGGPNARTERQLLVHPAGAARQPRRRAPPSPPRRDPRDEVDAGGLRRGRRRQAADGQAAGTNGRTAISRPASRKPRSCSTRPSRPTDTSHQPLETRTAMAYWQNGKLFIYTGTQSTAQTVRRRRALGRHRARGRRGHQRVQGGGFGSKITGAISLVIPALLSKKANAPVMMRITREEGALHRPRPSGVHGR